MLKSQSTVITQSWRLCVSSRTRT